MFTNENMPKTGFYVWVEDEEGRVISNSLFWDLPKEEARIEGIKLHRANPALHCRYIAGGKEIFKI